MGISKLVGLIRKNITSVDIRPRNKQYAFVLNQNSKEILVSHFQYNSSQEAKEEGNQFIKEMRSGNFKEIPSDIASEYL
ncbi:hypothetical protein KAI04_03305 [Candidatus Pacearchaeota archaeon]|nr:hypothetical protein [Candidatus Pacearchaeota archaeon]